MSDEPSTPHRRRARYAGKYPRRFDEKYKERHPERYPETVRKVLDAGKTPAGAHIPILTAEILEALDPQPGDTVVDCTLGCGGHALAMVRRIQPGGKLLGLDADPLELLKTEARIRRQVFGPDAFVARRSNFAGLPAALAAEALAGRTLAQTTDLAHAVRSTLTHVRSDEREQSVRRVFQALRIAVNEEFTALDTLLRHLPQCLNPGGCVAIVAFHSGEDRRVKKAFQAGLRDGLYSAISDDVVRPTAEECRANPRASAAKLRWARRPAVMA